MKHADAWPELPYAEWAPTMRTLHMVTQMLGKVRLALAPPQPEWLNACLYLDARGFSTGAIPYGPAALEMRIDVFDCTVRIQLSDGRSATIPLTPDRTVAAIWVDVRGALAGLGIRADLWDKPQEMDDPEPFTANTADRTLAPEQAQRFHRILCAVDGAFEQFRATFFGRSGIQFWWGAFDFCVILFTGRRVPAPTERGYILRYDLDAEHMNAGFWPGDERSPEARFFAYLVPRPPGCEVASIQPAPAAWVETMGEWTLPYEHVRSSADPRAAILEFLRSVFQFAVTDAGWDADAFRYEPPPPPPPRDGR